MPMKVRYETINGEVLSEARSGVHKQYIPDPLGSTVALVDDTQTITDTFSYWPYGEVASRTGATQTPFTYVGSFGYYKDSAGRIYVRARYLNVQVGRWNTGDSNRDKRFRVITRIYRYAGCNPVSRIDPSGLKTARECYEDWYEAPFNCGLYCEVVTSTTKDFKKCFASCIKTAGTDLLKCLNDATEKQWQPEPICINIPFKIDEPCTMDLLTCGLWTIIRKKLHAQ